MVMNLNGQVSTELDYCGTHLIISFLGTNNDIYAGVWANQGGRKVALKRHRQHISAISDSSVLQRIEKETFMLHSLQHEHILHIFGVHTDLGIYPVMVLPLMEHGDLYHFMIQHKASIGLSQKFRILCDIASAVSYLHSRPILHLNLHPHSILIDDSGKAILSGFAYAEFAEADGTASFSPIQLNSKRLRCSAPELYAISYDSEDIFRATTQSDVYSVGCIILFVLCNRMPYGSLIPVQVFCAMANGIPIGRPPGVPDIYWNLMTRCWNRSPRERPDINRIRSLLQTFHDAPCEADKAGIALEPPVDAKQQQTARIEICKPESRGRPTTTLSIPDLSQERNLKELCDLSGAVIRLDNNLTASGGFAYVIRAVWRKNTGDHCKVAIKVLKFQLTPDAALQKSIRKQLRRELRVWQSVLHENILPLYGIVSQPDLGPYPAMICPWMDNGCLNDYLEHRNETLTIPNRFKILLDVAAGLSYLHTSSVVHGDLTGSNVLINDKGRALLADFGLSIIVPEFEGTSYFPSRVSEAYRWTAPELHDVHEDESPSYSAMFTLLDLLCCRSVRLCYRDQAPHITAPQTLSGNVPYHYLRHNNVVLCHLAKGKRPRRPVETPTVTDEYWAFIGQCWEENPRDRPTADEVLVAIRTYLDASSSNS